MIKNQPTYQPNFAYSEVVTNLNTPILPTYQPFLLCYVRCSNSIYFYSKYKYRLVRLVGWWI